MSGLNPSDLNILDYYVCWQCWSLITSCSLQPKPKQLPIFKDALQSAVLEKAIDNTVKYHRRLQACVSANGGYVEHIM